ncbi:hypothetical protein JCM33374_g6354 [Metschnikowia sp. JCM 33374]|nr:hypothetical protein JCM33374_g6354 [Metschnikowia sp. JCM 33374]
MKLISYLNENICHGKQRDITTSHVSHDKGLPYKNCIASVCFKGTIWEKIDAIARVGFDSIEIMTTDLDEGSPDQILQYCEARHLSVSILQPFRDLEGYMCDQDFKNKLVRFEKTLIACKALRSDTILLCANCDKNSVADLELVVPQLREAADLAARYGVKIAYENLSWAAHYYQIETLVNIIEKVNKINFGACIDLFHINIHGSSLECLTRLSNKIFFVQYCDSPPLTKDIDILDHARNYRVFPFQGLYKNIFSSMKCLESLHYDGPLSLEVFNKSYKERTGQCTYVAEDALRSLVYLQAKFCDTFKATSYLPPSRITGIEIFNDFDNWSSVKISFGSPADEFDFSRRVTFLGFPEIKSTIISMNSHPSKLAKIRVMSRLAFNRTSLAIRTALGFEPQEAHVLNVNNEFNLPFQVVFGNENGVVLVLSLHEGGV